jgi:PAB1-binding protein PBP1
MADLGSFQVQSQTLRTHATLWKGHATDANSAHSMIESAIGRGEDFGWLAGLNEVSDHYNTWTTAMGTALQDAKTCFDYLEAALNSAANAYDGVDATAATDMGTLDKMIEPK